MTEWKPRFNYTWDWSPRLVQIGIWDAISLMMVGGNGIQHLRCLTDADPATGTGCLEIRGTIMPGKADRVQIALEKEEALIRVEEVEIADFFYVANTNEVRRSTYSPDVVRLTGAGERILELPYHEGDNGHWTRSLVASADDAKLYVGVGSATNIADEGMDIEEGRAAIWEFNPDGSGARVFASGLRNPVGMDWAPVTNALWVAVNERDMLGDNLVPDYMTSVRERAFYGRPYSYYGQNVDERVQPQRPDLVATALAPDYALGAHTASLGLHFYRGAALPEHYRGGVFVGQHGSWNRSVRAGYKVIFVPFSNGVPAGEPEDFLTGFLNERGETQGRARPAESSTWGHSARDHPRGAAVSSTASSSAARRLPAFAVPVPARSSAVP